MDKTATIIKTAKGVREISGKTSFLSRDLRKVLKTVDGKSSAEDLLGRLGNMPLASLEEALIQLEEESFIRELIPSRNSSEAGGESLDFTAAVNRAPRRAEEHIRKKAAPAKREAEAKGPQDSEDGMSGTAGILAKREAEESASGAAQEIARRHAAEHARREAVGGERRAVDERARTEAQQRDVRATEETLRREAAEQARRLAEEHIRRLAEEQGRRVEAERLRIETEERLLREVRLREQREVAEKARRAAEDRARQEVEERARHEAERRVREAADRARREAEERLRREAAEQARRVAEEAARRLAEEQARRDAEELARRTAEERAQCEAEDNAKRLAEERNRRKEAERLQREAEEGLRRESEEREKREAEQRMRRAAEELARKDAEEQARRETELRIREVEERARREAEESARRLAEEQAKREQAERLRVEAEQRRAEEAHARREAEEARRTEERARMAAEETARREEQRRRKAAEAQVRSEAKKQAVREAKEQAQDAATARERVKASRRAQKAAEKLARREAKQAAALDRHAPLRPIRWVSAALLLGFVLLAIGTAAIQMVSFDGRRAELEAAATAQFGQPVQIGAMHFSLRPRPHWRLDNVTIGARGPKVARVRLFASPAALFGNAPAYSEIRFESLVLGMEDARSILFGHPLANRLNADHVVVNDARIEARDLALPGFDASADLDTDGAWRHMVVRSADRRLRLELRPDQGRARFDFNADVLALPFGSSLVLKDVMAKGRLGPGDLAVSEFEGRAYGGVLGGNARLNWADQWRLDGQVKARALNAADLLPSWFGGGRLDGNANYSMRSDRADRLFVAQRVEGKLAMGEGSLAGLDLMRLAQGGDLRGKTSFSKLTAVFLHERGSTRVDAVKLIAGVLSAEGSAEADALGKVQGRFSTDINSSVLHGRGSLVLSGTTEKPVFRRQ